MKQLHRRSFTRSLVILFFMLLSVSAFAVPAKPGQKRLLTLVDGTTVNAILVGDEYAHYWMDANGNAYMAMIGNVYKRVDLETVKQRSESRRSAANQQRLRRMAPHKVGEFGNLIGQKKGLIILVNFTDVAFKPDNDNALYQRIANEKNFSFGNFKGSMYDYFYDQSEGKFELTFDVVGPVTVSKTQSYYGGNDDRTGNDKHPAEMVIEALKLVDSQVNFKDYDWDDDGEVDQVYVVYAGKGEADGGDDDTIWPHEWNLLAAWYQHHDGTGSQMFDGVSINTYACGGELNGDDNIAGIGTMCHEFSHCLGFPDFYDTDYSGAQGMYKWDLMDSGSYNGDGYCPAGYTSYERWMAGWKDPIELVNSQDINNMGALQDYGSNTYVIYNDGNTNEYFLLENRQKKRWDAELPGAGLLLLHVDYDYLAWRQSKVNDAPDHQRMTWIPADNEYQKLIFWGIDFGYTEDGAANDPFPFESLNAFGKNTQLPISLYNKNKNGTYYLEASVEYITQNSDGTISFRFNSGNKKLTININPDGGIVNYMQEVVLSTTENDANIYYTLDGTDPTISSSLYVNPLKIERNQTLKAKAVLNGFEDSDILTKDFQVKLDVNATPNPGDIEAGQAVTLSCVHPEATIYYTTDGSTPTEQSNVYSSIVLQNSATIKAVAMYEECLPSDVKTFNYNVVPKTKVMLNITPFSGIVQKGTSVYINSTPSNADIYFTLDGDVPTKSSSKYDGTSVAIQKNTTLKAVAYADGYTDSDILTAEYNVKLTLQASQASGTVDYLSEVVLNSDEPDATIYYTTDGSTPSKASLTYTKPIVIDESMTVKAIAFHDDYLDSDILSCDYAIRTAIVSVTPDASEHLTPGTEIFLMANPSDSKIYYTTDGSEPTESSTLYTNPIIAERNFVLKAKAFRDGYKPSGILEESYNVSQVEPTKLTILPSELELLCGQTVQLGYSCTPKGAVITTLEWKSSNPEVATIDENGLVEALQCGHATLTATTQNGVTGKCELEVREAGLRFYVWLQNGEVHGYDLETHPKVKLGKKEFTLTTTSQTIEYKAIDVLRFTLQEEGTIEDGISAPKVMEDVQFRKGTLLFAGCIPHSPVHIYDTAGRMIQSAQTDGEGYLTLSLTLLRKGIYIVKTNNTTIKIQKQ